MTTRADIDLARKLGYLEGRIDGQAELLDFVFTQLTQINRRIEVVNKRIDSLNPRLNDPKR
jgi:hypothetical protein